MMIRSYQRQTGRSNVSNFSAVNYALFSIGKITCYTTYIHDGIGITDRFGCRSTLTRNYSLAVEEEGC